MKLLSGFNLNLLSRVLLAGLGWFAGCKPAAPHAANSPAAKPPTLTFSSSSIGGAASAKPWITHVAFADLDRDGLMDALVCDAAENAVTWVRQYPRGTYTEITLAGNLPAPVHTAVVDLDHDGDSDILVACMGRVFPTNERIGSVIVLENVGNNQFKPRSLIENTYRVTDVEPGDFNQDGRIDLAVGKFGYYEGEVTWLENLGDGKFREHRLLALPGTVNVCVGDLLGNGPDDIVAVISQQYEEIHLFANQGHGEFTSQTIFGSTNEDFGSSGISLCDVNRDGKVDVLYSNGDGFDYAEPGSRPWHGVQWLENRGGGNFAYHRVGNLPGAYSPIGVDLDGDGHVDIVATSCFNDWKNPSAVSLMAYLNDGHEQFTPVPLATSPTHLVSVAAADADGDGAPELLTGGFHAYPPWDRVSRVRLWHRAPSPR